MRRQPATPSPPTWPDRIGPGRLILVVGPSGAGKDTLLQRARHLLGPRAGLHFARRLETRDNPSGEDHHASDAEHHPVSRAGQSAVSISSYVGPAELHEPISPMAFWRAQAAGHYVLSWQAHGLDYALGPDVGRHLMAGDCVVANGSRATLHEARRLFAHLSVVLITAPAALLAGRLAARGREDAQAMRERLERAPALPFAPDLILHNTGPVDEAAHALARFITRETGECAFTGDNAGCGSS